MTDVQPHSPQPPSDSKDNAANEGETIRVVRSEDLFAGGRVVLIQHGDEQYRLLVTRNDRLILQK
ncbi:MAG: hemin uptake protein HemP [Pirellulales bacterium]